MQILIVSATYVEVEFLITHFDAKKMGERLYNFYLNNNNFDILITGIGLAATSFFLTNTLSSKKYDFVLNMGICGSFKHNISIGSVVSVISQHYGDLGAEDGNQFIPFANIKLSKSENIFNQFSFKNPNSTIAKLPHVNSISVNKVHGKEESIKQVIEIFNPDIESMEGLAIFFVCIQKEIPFLEIRAVSNYVERRNVSNWNIPLALENLTQEAVKICHSFDKAL
jgi:futalosine hydrolase